MAEPNPNTRLISGSEVKSFQNCQRRWWFEYRLGVTPKKLSDGLFKGVVGHEALSAYYRAIKNGASVKEATYEMNLIIVQENAKNVQLMAEGVIYPQMMGERVALITYIGEILAAYVIRYGEEDYERYEVVEVEHMHVGDNFNAMRLDLLVRDRSDGKLVLIDHKFVTDFYDDNQLLANTQLPLYMRVVIGDRSEEIKSGFLNEVRTRKLTNGPEFYRAEIPYEEEVATELAHNQAIVTEQIREQYRVQWEGDGTNTRRSTIRNLGDYTCKFCPFKKPCLTYELRGKVAEMKHTINTEYEVNTYGYNK